MTSPRRHGVLGLCCAALSLAAPRLGNCAATPDKPNIVWFLTDDQDQMLGSSFPEHGGVGPMPKTKALMQQQGATSTNMFIHTPICCPSRSELLSGKYLHNIKEVGGGCMHVNESIVNPNTFAKNLKQGGYTVGMFGKYLNNLPTKLTAGSDAQLKNGTYVPVGFDAWLANGGGDYIAPKFATQNIKFDGYELPDGQWHGSEHNYTTSVVGNVSIAWIRHVVKQDPTRPFFAYVAPKAAHEPFNPAPWYRTLWDDSWPSSEPRDNPAWNCSAEARADHHGNVATEDMITAEAAVVISDIFKNRWRTLMSVDDAIAGVIAACEELGIADHTYFFYSSDHGFQLGEFNIPMDKRQPYDWDTRIHLLSRGPGIPKGSTVKQPMTQVDMAPTFLGLAGIAKPAYMDGKSIAPLLMGGAFAALESPSGVASAVTTPDSTSSPLASTTRHLRALLDAVGGSAAAYAKGWRDAAFIEYYYVEANVKCVGNCTPPAEVAGYPHRDSWCGDLSDGENAKCWALYGCDTNCYPTESPANNFIVLRSMPGSEFGDSAYMEFQSGQLSEKQIDFAKPDFYELYNTTADRWMMDNLYKTTPASTLGAMHAKLRVFATCVGDACP